MPEFNSERRKELPDKEDFSESIWDEGEPIREYLEENRNDTV